MVLCAVYQVLAVNKYRAAHHLAYRARISSRIYDINTAVLLFVATLNLCFLDKS